MNERKQQDEIQHEIENKRRKGEKEKEQKKRENEKRENEIKENEKKHSYLPSNVKELPKCVSSLYPDSLQY